MNISVTEEQVKFIDKLVIEHDFANRSELMRILVRKLKANPDMLQEPSVQLSEKAIKRYNKISEDIASGKEKVYVAESVEDLFDQLDGRKNPVLARLPKKLQKARKIKRKVKKETQGTRENIYSRPQTSGS